MECLEEVFVGFYCAESNLNEINSLIRGMLHLRCVFVWVFSLAGSVVGAQTIVNTETLMLDADEDLQWTAGASGDFSRGNSNVIDLSLDGGAAWNKRRWGLRAAGAWARLAEDGNDIQSNSFAQLRITWGEARIVQPFAFVQTSRNNILLLSQRNLAGAGLKRRMVGGESFFLDTSVGAFFEREIYAAEANEPIQRQFRNSVILSAGWEASEKALIRVTAYAQSSYSNWSDSRLFVESSLNFELSKKLDFEWHVGYRWDGDPHGDLGKWDLGNTVGLRLGLDRG